MIDDSSLSDTLRFFVWFFIHFQAMRIASKISLLTVEIHLTRREKERGFFFLHEKNWFHFLSQFRSKAKCLRLLILLKTFPVNMLTEN